MWTRGTCVHFWGRYKPNVFLLFPCRFSLLLCLNFCKQEEPVLIFETGIRQMYSFCFHLDSQPHEEEEELVRSAALLMSSSHFLILNNDTVPRIFMEFARGYYVIPVSFLSSYSAGFRKRFVPAQHGIPFKDSCLSWRPLTCPLRCCLGTMDASPPRAYCQRRSAEH